MTAYSLADLHVFHIHIPKTAGLTVTRFFESNGFKSSLIEFGTHRELEIMLKKCSYQHMHAEMTSAVINAAMFTWFFTIVRHPVDRLKSAYIWNTFNAPIRPKFEDWVKEIFEKYKRNPYVLDNHIRPQHEFILPNTQILKLENGLNEEFIKNIERNVPVKFTNRHFSRYNDISGVAASNPADIKFSSDIMNQIRFFYKKDYELFEYD